MTTPRRKPPYTAFHACHLARIGQLAGAEVGSERDERMAAVVPGCIASRDRRAAFARAQLALRDEPSLRKGAGVVDASGKVCGHLPFARPAVASTSPLALSVTSRGLTP